jgi:hypothetical protein
MEVDVVTEILIEQPRAVVAAFAGDPANAPRWYRNIASVTWQTPPPVAVGSRLDFVAHFLGRTLSYTYEVSELVENQRLVMRTADGPFPMETTYTWTDHGPTATTMSLRNTGTPRGFARVSGPLMVSAMRRANAKDLADLKELLEAVGRPGHHR